MQFILSQQYEGYPNILKDTLTQNNLGEGIPHFIEQLSLLHAKVAQSSVNKYKEFLKVILYYLIIYRMCLYLCQNKPKQYLSN